MEKPNDPADTPVILAQMSARQAQELREAGTCALVISLLMPDGNIYGVDTDLKPPDLKLTRQELWVRYIEPGLASILNRSNARNECR